MKNIIINWLACMVLVFCLYSCSSTKIRHTTHLEAIAHTPIAQQPQMAEYTLTSDARISGKADAKGSGSNTPNAEIVKDAAVYDALKTNKADFLVQPLYTITTRKTFNSTRIFVEVSGYPAKYTDIKPITGDNKRILEILDTLEMFVSAAPVDDDAHQQQDWARMTTKEQDKLRAFLTEDEVKGEAAAPAPRNDDGGYSGTEIRYHTVEANETVNSVSREFNITTDDFRRWNNNPKELEPGTQVIVYMPGKGGAAPAKPEGKQAQAKEAKGKQKADSQSAAPVTPPVDASKYTYHVVEADETLYHIASTYHITVQQLRDWNKLGYGNVSVGQKLIVGK